MKKVLVADDSLFARSVLKNMLAQIGYEVIAEADNGYDAVIKYVECQPDIVTMDITMPGINGVEASKEILKLNPKANILVISALGQQQFIMDLLKIGVKDYIFKPVNAELFISTMKSIG